MKDCGGLRRRTGLFAPLRESLPPISWTRGDNSVYFGPNRKIYVHPTYDPIRGKVSTWISGIARNTAFDLLKEWNDHTQTTVEPIPEFSSEEDESTTSSPLHLLLTQALEMLSDREKDILLTYLMYEDGTKYLPGTVLQELCTRHGITADNARQIKSRAMKKLRQQIQLLEMDK